jgi:hypothetical protein
MAKIRPYPNLDDVCSALRSERRRRTVRLLADRPETTTTRAELARTLAEDDPEGATSDAVELSLYHVHLPKLADVDAIRYDADAGTVAITEAGRRMHRFLDGVGRGRRE